jgi:hypothetical protein
LLTPARGLAGAMSIRDIVPADRPDWGMRDRLWHSDSIAAHRALGYEEIERVVCFRPLLGGD